MSKSKMRKACFVGVVISFIGLFWTGNLSFLVPCALFELASI